MLELFSPQTPVELFIDYLDRLIINHYAILYPKKKNFPIDEDFLNINGIYARLLYAAANQSDYPADQISQYPVAAQIGVGVPEDVFRAMKSTRMEGAIIQYCERIDELVQDGAIKRAEKDYIVTCSLLSHRVEILEKLYFLINQQVDNKKKIKKKTSL